MPRLPIGKDHSARLRLADYTCHLQPVLPSVFDSAIGDVECPAPSRLQDARCVSGLAGAVIGSAARSHFTLREIENAGAVSALRHLQQRAAAGLLYIIAMGGD